VLLNFFFKFQGNIVQATYRMNWTAGAQHLRELILYRRLRRTAKSDC
jgi:hypothetical protein